MRRLGSVLSPRGPDGQGFLCMTADGRITVGPEARVPEATRLCLINRRLAIIDLGPRGAQPMITSDGRLAVSFNGEIYNFQELRTFLEQRGYIFRSRSDTEVILAGFREWGLDALVRFDGMFAFALLDVLAGRLILARDRFGIKPLYYAWQPSGLVFASEIKALLEVPGVSRRADDHSVYNYLRFGLTDRAPDTMFADIKQLPPGHSLSIGLETPTPQSSTPYWRPRAAEPVRMSFRQAAYVVRETVVESVRKHLISDVPVAALLSGGIDSSTVVAAMRRAGGPDLPIHVFSFLPDSPDLSEERFSRLVARRVGAIYHPVRLREADLSPHQLDQLILVQDEPFTSMSVLAQYWTYRAAQEAGIKAILSGQGADEIFAGYPRELRYHFEALLREQHPLSAALFVLGTSRIPGYRWQPLASQTHAVIMKGVRKFLRERVSKAAFRFIEDSILTPAGRWPLKTEGIERPSPNLNPHWMQRLGLNGSERPPYWDPRDLPERMVKALTEWSLPHLLRYEDRNAMAWSVENRVPFVTESVVALALSLPPSHLVSGYAVTKAVLRQAMRGLVPRAVLNRREKVGGLAVPHTAWLNRIQGWVDGVLRDCSSRDIPCIDLDAVRDDWAGVVEGRLRFDTRVWRWINLIRWAQLYRVGFD